MAMPSMSQVFEAQLSKSRIHLAEMIQDHLRSACEEVAVYANSPGTYLSKDPALAVTELGDYLARTAVFWSVFMRNLIGGHQLESRIHALSTELHENAHYISNLADISPITRLDLDVSRLRKMTKLSEKYSRDMQSIWRPRTDSVRAVKPENLVVSNATKSPQASAKGLDLKLDLSLDLKLGLKADQPHQLLPDDPCPALLVGGNALSEPGHHDAMALTDSVISNHYLDVDNDEDDEDDDDDEQFKRVIDMEKLKQRGKGTYFCPKGHQCNKGGVDKSGNLVLFDRNSSFAQHCNKHRKPWRCDVPGCPNPPKKRKFARRDGLERHKQTVKHLGSTQWGLERSIV